MFIWMLWGRIVIRMNILFILTWHLKLIMNRFQNKYFPFRTWEEGKYIFLSKMAGYYVLSPFKLTIVRNSITRLDNAVQYNKDCDRKDSENNSITVSTKESFWNRHFHGCWVLADIYGTILFWFLKKLFTVLLKPIDEIKCLLFFFLASSHIFKLKLTQPS